MKKIVMTGGGSAGHVTPNLALIPKLKDTQWDIHYIGSKDGIERDLIEAINIDYHPISSGKLRRYFDWKNFKDPFKVVTGIAQAYAIIRKLKPDVIFSKGGFVSVPVVIAGWLNQVPVYIHESDITPGLANKIAVKFATKIFVTFEEAATHLPGEKAIHAGSPIREEILKGSRSNGLEFLGFTSKKPIITVMGGSLGSKRLNDAVRNILPDLLKNFQVIHLCGKGNIDTAFEDLAGYKQFQYVNEELPDLLAATDLVVSRAGSNAIFEFLALRKPMLLIPLSKNASRGDQILNARSFEKKGFATVLYEENLTKETLFDQITSLFEQRYDYKDHMNQNASANGIEDILKTLEETVKTENQ